MSTTPSRSADSSAPGSPASTTSTPDNYTSSGPIIITVLVVVLLILHQDNWFWNSGTLVFGFMPIGLFWHACLSVAAMLTWALATKIAWPLDDSEAEKGDTP